MAKSDANVIDAVIGARIRLRRQEAGVSQRELATSAGVSFQQIQKYEAGINRISAASLVAFSRALKCPVTALVGDDGRAPFPPSEQEDALLAELLRLLGVPGAADLLRDYALLVSENRTLLNRMARALADKRTETSPPEVAT